MQKYSRRLTQSNFRMASISACRPARVFKLDLLQCLLPPLHHFAFSNALSLQWHMINLNDHDPVAIASLAHFVEHARLQALAAASLKAILELRVPKIPAAASLQTATE